jgi:CubicO group peptidase (beta-lactamase class C family)
MGTSHAGADDAAPVPPRIATADALAGFDDFVDDALKRWQAPGVAIAIVRDGEIVLVKGYGVRRPGLPEPVTADTIFPIFSATKPFVAFGAGLLVDDGRLDFDAPVRTYLPTFAMHDPVATTQVSMRDLLSHRTGLANHWFVWYHEFQMTRAQLLARLPHLTSSAPLRTAWQYSNNGYAIAGHVIEKIAGVPWERYTETRIFQPLGMTRTGFSFDAAKRDPDHANGVVLRHGKYISTPMPRVEPHATPAGGIYSTARDLASWLRLHLANGEFDGRAITRAETLQAQHATTIPTHWTFYAPERIRIGYALGWFTEVYRGTPLVTHGGNDWGISTQLAFLPREGLGVVILANQNASRLPYALMRNVFDRFLGAAPRDWVRDELAAQRATEASAAQELSARDSQRVAGTRPGHPLTDYAGTYLHPGYGTVSIRLEQGRLIADRSGDLAPLEHWHYEVFAADSPDFTNAWAPDGERARLAFAADFEGRIATLRISGTEAGVVFERQP